MVAGNTEDTTLGVSRIRFLESLPRKAIELRGAVAQLSEMPSAEGPRDDMQRRLQALYASALVFRNDALARAVHEAIERLDAAREAGRSLQQPDLELLATLVKRLPDLRGEDANPYSVPPPELAFTPRTMPPPAPASVRAFGRSSSPPMQRERGLLGDGERPLLQRVLHVLLLPAQGEQAELIELLRGDSLRVSVVASVEEVIASVHEDAPDLVLANEQLAVRGGLLAALRTEASADASTDFVPVVVYQGTPSGKGSDYDGRHGGSAAPDEPSRALAAPVPLGTPLSTIDSALRPRVLGDGSAEAEDMVDGRVLWPFRADQLLRTIGRATGTLVEPIEPRAVGSLTLDELAERVAREVKRGLVDCVTQGRAQRISLGDGADVLAAAYGAIAELRAAVVRDSGGRVAFEPRGRNGVPALVTAVPGRLTSGATRAPAVATGPDKPSADLSSSPSLLAQEAQRLHGRRVVLAEDDTAIALLLANLLRQQGATVHEFTDGRSACDAARRERPALVITGARVPDMDGFSLCRELARDPLLADVPVLLLPPKEQLLTRAKDLSSTAQLQRELAEQVVLSASRLLAPRAELEAKLLEHGELRGSLDGMGVIALLRSVRRARPDARVRVRDAWNLFECELRDGRLAQVTRTASDGSFVRNERALPQLLGATAGRYSVVASDAPMKSHFEGTLDEVLMRGARELAGELDAVSGPSLSRVARIVFDEDAYALLVEQTPRAVRQVIERLYAGDAPSKLLKSGAVDVDTLEPILLDLARRGAVRGVVGNAGEDLVAEARAARASEHPIELASPLSVVPPPPNPVISVRPGASAAPAPIGVVPGLLELHGDPELPSAPHLAAARATGTEPLSVLVAPASRSSAPPGGPGHGSAQPHGPEAHGAQAHGPQPRVHGHTAPALSADEQRRISAQAAAAARTREASLVDASELAAAAAEARRSRSTLAAWTVALLGLFAVALFVAREPEGGAMPEALGGGGPIVAPAPAAPKPTTLQPRQKGGSLISAEDNGFAVYDGILDPAVEVPPEHAQLIVEATSALAGASVFVNDRELGAPPQTLSLPEGVHELAIKRGDAISYRFVSVHAGRTWVLRSP
jgi:CheY-like chemotaxis protein